VTTDDDDDVCRLTPKGLAALADDEDGTTPLSPYDALSLEVMRQIGGECTSRELDHYCDELVAAYGDDAKALAALRNGEAGFAKIN
jgi:hypothetical protein